MCVLITYEYKPRKNTFARRALIDGRPLLSNKTTFFDQHFKILETLAITPGVVSYALLAHSIGSKSAEPSRLLATRIAQLQPALPPHKLRIVNYRDLGYALRKAA